MTDKPTDKPKTDDPMEDAQMYGEWIASRRAVEPPQELADRVMASVEKQSVQRNRVSLVDRVNESQPARLAACVASLLVGCVPFLYAAYVAELLVF